MSLQYSFVAPGWISLYSLSPKNIIQDTLHMYHDKGSWSYQTQSVPNRFSHFQSRRVKKMNSVLYYQVCNFF